MHLNSLQHSEQISDIPLLIFCLHQEMDWMSCHFVKMARLLKPLKQLIYAHQYSHRVIWHQFYLNLPTDKSASQAVVAAVLYPLLNNFLLLVLKHHCSSLLDANRGRYQTHEFQAA